MAYRLHGKLPSPPLVGAIVATGRYRDAGLFAAECFVQACGCPCYVIDEQDLLRVRELCGQHIPRPVADDLLPFAARWFVFDLLEDRPADTILYFDADLLFLNPFDAGELLKSPADNPGAPLKVVRDELHRDVRLECTRQGIDPDRYFNGGLLVMTHDALPVLRQACALCGSFESVYRDQSFTNKAAQLPRFGPRMVGFLPREWNLIKAGKSQETDRFQLLGGHFSKSPPEQFPTLEKLYANRGFVPIRQPYAGLWRYNRAGLGSRLVELRPDGSIGRGQADCERWWWVWEESGCRRLAVYGLYGLPQEFSPNTGGCRTDLTLEAVESGDGRFTGRWVRHEECPIRLERVRGD